MCTHASVRARVRVYVSFAVKEMIMMVMMIITVHTRIKISAELYRVSQV